MTLAAAERAWASVQAHFELVKGGELAAVERLTPKGDAFVDIVIEGVRFQATARGVPVVRVVGGVGGSCFLGAASIALARPKYGMLRKQRDLEWSVCKYRRQAHIPIPTLSEAGRRSLAYEFGMPLLGGDEERLVQGQMNESLGFYQSPAFASLSEWVERHPGIARSGSSGGHLGNWAINAAGSRSAGKARRLP